MTGYPARRLARKSLEDFDVDHARGLKRDLIAHVGTLDFVAAKDSALLLGLPGPATTHLTTGLGNPGLAGRRPGAVRDRLRVGHPNGRCTRAGRLQDELRRLGRYPLLVVDEVGDIPLEPEAVNLFFWLVSSRYEWASLIVTGNKPFGRWGELVGDEPSNPSVARVHFRPSLPVRGLMGKHRRSEAVTVWIRAVRITLGWCTIRPSDTARQLDGRARVARPAPTAPAEEP